MNKLNNKILFVIILVLVLALAGLILRQKFLSSSFSSERYSAVYLTSGDLYFGKLSHFSKYTLSDVWLLQRNPQDEKNPLSINSFERVFWEPEGKIKINPDNVLWVAKLKKDSQIVQFILGQKNRVGQESSVPAPDIVTSPIPEAFLPTPLD